MNITDEEAKKMSEERLARCIPVAKELLKFIALKETPMGKLTDEDKHVYGTMSGEIIQILLNHNVRVTDKEFIFQLAMQAIEEAKTIVVNSLQISFEKANDILWKKDIFDLELQDIDNILKGNDNEVKIGHA